MQHGHAQSGKAGHSIAMPRIIVALTPGILALAGCGAGGGASVASTAELLETYCIDCHNSVDFAGELVLNPSALVEPGSDAETWERVVHKLADQSMPPPENARPAPEAYLAARHYLEAELDREALAAPNPGELPLFRRLTRTEYANSIRDLLAIEHMPSELDFELLLPADNASSGFDNIADLLFVSPPIMERYIAAAQKIARLAVGDMRAPEMVNIHMLSEQLPQTERVESLPFGTRGGLAVETYLPLDAEYVVRIELARRAREAHEIELLVDNARVGLVTVGGPSEESAPFSATDNAVEFRVPISAGPHLLGITFVQRSEAFDEELRRSRMRGRGSDPAIAMATISGPYDATGPGETPSRERIFVCTPQSRAEELPCAREILARLAQRAYRRAVDAADVDELLPFFTEGTAEGGFEAGIQFALERLLVSPQFLYRIERALDEASGVAHISDVELASRMSFFLWSSIPDDELLELAIAGRLREPGVLQDQIERMLADPRAESMVTNFAAQWLFLRDVPTKEPDIFLFPDYDESIRAAFVRETELFVDSILRSERSVVELLTANYTFLNERLARHYGVENVQGSQFRRVEFDDGSTRGGLLGQGGILTVTSYSTRTSPVLRGKYVLENLLASPPPPPPPDVPALETEESQAGGTETLREAMTRHRADPVCASCHIRMDAVGFALEQFDAVGRFRETTDGRPIDTASRLPDGSLIEGVDGVRALIVGDPERFVTALAEKLLMYALGRNVQYYDAPAIRAIVRGAAAQDYRFSAILRGVVESVPFQMRAARESEDRNGTVALATQ